MTAPVVTGSQLDTFVCFLVNTFKAKGKIAGYPLQIIDGPGAADIRNNVLFIGYSLISPTFSAAGSQDWASLGRPVNCRKESLEVNCSLRVGSGNKDMPGCRKRVSAIFDELALIIRSTVPGGQFQQQQITRYRLYQEMTPDGVSAIMDFTVTAVARI